MEPIDKSIKEMEAALALLKEGQKGKVIDWRKIDELLKGIQLIVNEEKGKYVKIIETIIKEMKSSHKGFSIKEDYDDPYALINVYIHKEEREFLNNRKYMMMIIHFFGDGHITFTFDHLRFKRYDPEEKILSDFKEKVSRYLKKEIEAYVPKGEELAKFRS